VDPGRIAAQAITGIGFWWCGVISPVQELNQRPDNSSIQWGGLRNRFGNRAQGITNPSFRSVVSAIAGSFLLVGLKGIEKKLSKTVLV